MEVPPHSRGPMVQIKRLQAAQVGDYRLIRLSALRTTPDAFGSTYSIEVDRPMAQHAERVASTTILGAYDGEDIIGMLGFRRESGVKDEHKGFLWGFFVDPTYRGRGVGGKLIEAMLEEVRCVVEQVTLSVVADSVGVVRLYERCGFVRFGVEPRASKTKTRYFDEILMVCFF